MGEAKRRGTFEERKAQAIAKRLDTARLSRERMAAEEQRRWQARMEMRERLAPPAIIPTVHRETVSLSGHPVKVLICDDEPPRPRRVGISGIGRGGGLGLIIAATLIAAGYDVEGRKR